MSQIPSFRDKLPFNSVKWAVSIVEILFMILPKAVWKNCDSLIFSARIKFSSFPNGPNWPSLTMKLISPSIPFIWACWVVALPSIFNFALNDAVPLNASFIPAASRSAFSTLIFWPLRSAFISILTRLTLISPDTLPLKIFVARLFRYSMLLRNTIWEIVLVSSIFPVTIFLKLICPFGI